MELPTDRKSNEPPRKNQGYKRRTEITRRDALKLILPGGWIPEAKRYGFSELSNAAKVSMAKDAVLLLGPGAFITKKSLEQQPTKEKPLNEVLSNFTWMDVEDDNRLQRLTAILADEYLKSTQSKRVTKEDLSGPGRTKFHRKTTEFVESVHHLDPSDTVLDDQWGYADIKGTTVQIDLENLQKVAVVEGLEGGTALIDALWHEWGHLDVVERTEGELINNPAAGLVSPDGVTEMFKSYYGGAVKTESFVGFGRFDEVLNESINARRMAEHAGLQRIMTAGGYYENGVSFFPLLTSALNISLDTLYQMHATSDFEGLAALIGERLPGDASAVGKGIDLFIAIQQSDANLIAQTGALDLIPQV